MLTITLLRCFYLLLVTPLILYALGTLHLLYIYARHARARPRLPALDDDQLPPVTVQIPLFNERYVARRVIEAVLKLDYPRDRLHIQILDDSTDDTTALIQGRINRLRAEGWRIDLIRRAERSGFKGGALANGLAQTSSEFIAIFDADFVPPPDFLRRTIPCFFADERIGAVQGRWGHLNAGDNLLTRSQALMLDGHFAVEQVARSNGGLLMTFNGSAGLWRRQCIQEAGGWASDTLAEDADLSYRAQIKGWRLVFLPEVVTPAELSPQMSGFKQQQARWAQGTTQVLLKVSGALWRSSLGLRQRITGILQLTAYPIQPLSLGVLCLMPIMIVTDSLSVVPLAPLGLAGFAVPLLYVVGQAALYPNWLQRSLLLPLLLVFSAGIALSNSSAVLSALRGVPGEFRRTPKFRLEGQTAGCWRSSDYAAMVDKHILWEVGFGIYALFGMTVAAQFAPSFIPYFLLYALGFFSVAAWGLADQWLTTRITLPTHGDR